MMHLSITWVIYQKWGVVEVKKTKKSTNVYKEKPKVGGLCLGVKIIQVQPIDRFFERISIGGG
jgi:hypothetical protein